MAVTRLLICSVLVRAAHAGSSVRDVEGRAAAGAAKVLNELSMAEGMIQKELRGHPKIVEEEMQLLHGAEDAARHSHGASGLIQQKAKESLGVGTGKILGELGAVEGMVEKALRGHPQELRVEEQALHQAERAAKALQHPRAGSLVELGKTRAESLQKLHAGAEQLEQQRSRAAAAALREERSYSKAEGRLSKDGEKMLSEFTSLEDSIAQAFAGKDSKAVRTAMKAGQLLEQARDDQQHVTQSEAAEAAKAGKKADVLAAALTQTSAESKAAQAQRAYTSGMANLVKDEKAVLSEFSGLKGAVAQAFAGKDSKAVEKAMEVGELLDRAQGVAKQVETQDAKNVADASKLFRDVAEHAPHRSDKKAFLQKQRESSAAAMAAHTARLQSLASNENRIVRLTEHAEDAITRELAKDGGRAAMAAEHEVIGMLEQARHSEESARNAVGHAARMAAARK